MHGMTRGDLQFLVFVAEEGSSAVKRCHITQQA
jgi:hypothetical protein